MARDGRGTVPEEIVGNPALKKHYFRMLNEVRNQARLTGERPDDDVFAEAWRESARAAGLL